LMLPLAERVLGRWKLGGKMLLFVLSFAYLWIYEGDSLYKGLSEGTVITRDSIFLGNKIEEFSWESSGFVSDILRIDKDIYFSISDVGIIARKQDDGTIDTVLTREGSLISLGKKGNTLVAGLSPFGKIFFIKGSKILDSLSAPSDNIYCMFEFSSERGQKAKFISLLMTKNLRSILKHKLLLLHSGLKKIIISF